MALSPPVRELTFRGLVLGALITIVFTASNAYLGLKIGLTFASSIPAAVISMVALRALGGGSILENNMVQSQASAAGTLSCVFATFPALVLIGHWNHFPYLETAGLSLVGGMAGVLFTIPLRHAMVNNSTLPYPEGVAAAEILRAGDAKEKAAENSRNLRTLITGGGVSAAFAFASGGLRLLSDGASATFVAGGAVFRASAGFSLALIGAGYLVGIAGGIAMLIGVILAWGFAVPWLTATDPNPQHLAAQAFAMSEWVHKVRFIGAGAIALAAIWTIGELAGPVVRGVRTALLSKPETDDRDLSPRVMLLLGLALTAALAALLALFLAPFTHALIVPVLAGTLFFLVFGFLTAAACGYMAGLVGSSSSPISGISLIATILVSAMLLGLEQLGVMPDVMSANHQHLAVAFTIVILSALVAAAAISNDNLQDLKTGLLVGASPWKQEVALLVGCISGALVLPPIFNLLYQAYGFTGSMPHPGMDPAHALAAPHPALIAMISNGIFQRNLDWSMIDIGLVVGAVLIVLNALLKRIHLTLPPLAVGIGLYLPAAVSVTLAIGAGLGWWIKRNRKADQAESVSGTMVASGFIVGESLMGVVLAGVSGMSGNDATLAIVGPGFAPFDVVLGLLAFAAACVWFTRKA